MYELAAATVEYGRQVGTRILEGYPIEPSPGKNVIWGEASVGLLQVFLDAGYDGESVACWWQTVSGMEAPDPKRGRPHAV